MGCVGILIMSIKNKYKVTSIQPFQTHEWLMKKHYARRMPNIVYAFGLFENDLLVGVCTFGMPPTPFFSTLFVGETYYELNRLCVNEGLDKNSLSYFVSNCLKQIKNCVIVSYADPNNGHSGYIYQATNWVYTGAGRVNEKDERGVNRFFFNGKEFHERHIPETMARYKFKIDEAKTKNENWIANGGEILKQERKHRYFFICGNTKFKEKMNKIINEHFNIKPYPKGNNTRYDASYNPSVQTELF